MVIQDDAIEPAPRNAEHEQLLAVQRDTAHARGALAKHGKLVNDLETQLHDCDSSLIRLDADCKSKLEEHKKYRDGHARRLMYRFTGNKNKFDKRVNEARRENERIHKKLQNEHSRNASLRVVVKDAIQARDELPSSSLLHDSAQCQLRHIGLGSLPVGAGDGFPGAGVDDIHPFSTIDKLMEQLRRKDKGPAALELEEFMRGL